jgi:hypothetical protein
MGAAQRYDLLFCFHFLHCHRVSIFAAAAAGTVLALPQNAHGFGTVLAVKGLALQVTPTSPA